MKQLINKAHQALVLSRLEKKALQLGLQKMFRDNHCFSICDYEKLCKVAGINPHNEHYNALRALHCTNWSDMDTETKKLIFEAVVDTFENPVFDMDRLADIPMLQDVTESIN